MRIPATLAVALLIAAAPLLAQRDLAGSAAIQLGLRKLATTGSVMMIAAHPDDENTALLAYFARGQALRTAYLSLTRGEGGQNLIGPEQGALLGVIRTQELLAARRIDGAEQYFTRAIDFGFSKTAPESLDKWGRERILADIVWNIRRFRPDVIILRFSGTPRDGHGQHQASALLGKEAFIAAADPARFPEQLRTYPVWQARRLLWNTFSFTAEQERESAALPNRIPIDTGDFSPLLGYSYAEIAGMSRSMHRSQAMGAPERKGSQKQYLVTVAGPSAPDLFEGVDITWNRFTQPATTTPTATLVPTTTTTSAATTNPTITTTPTVTTEPRPQGSGAAIAALLARAQSAFRPDHPESILPALAQTRPLIAALPDPLARRKLIELDELMAQAAGISIAALADRWNATPGSSLQVTPEIFVRTHVPVELKSLELAGRTTIPTAAALPFNESRLPAITTPIPATAPYSQPYWLTRAPHGDTYDVDNPALLGLADQPPLFTLRVRLALAGTEIQIERPVRYRYVDRVLGELTRPVVIAPPAAIRLTERSLVFPSASARPVDAELRTIQATGSATVRLSPPAGWTADPPSRALPLPAAGQQSMLSFTLRPDGPGTATIRAAADVNGRTVDTGITVIDYPHIPPQVLFPPAEARLVRTDIRTLAHHIGYVTGAGDQIPESLRQIGCDVTFLTPDLLATGDLARFDAIVTGVRAFTTRADLRANQPRLLDYVRSGGTLVVQYNTLDGLPLDRIGPYPIEISHARVSVEEAPVRFTDPASPLLATPNRITPADFEGWIQERGLYFASTWDPRYKTLVESNDPGEKPQAGGLLYAPLGRGAYVFTAYSWFRELPAGVPGAYRIFANLLSAGKTLQH